MRSGVLSNAQLVEQCKTFPKHAATVKMHKDLPTLRFLARSHENGLRDVALWLTSLLRGISPLLVTVRQQVLKRAGVEGWTDKPWCCSNTEQVATVVQSFSKARVDMP